MKKKPRSRDVCVRERKASDGGQEGKKSGSTIMSTGPRARVRRFDEKLKERRNAMGLVSDRFEPSFGVAREWEDERGKREAVR